MIAFVTGPFTVALPYIGYGIVLLCTLFLFAVKRRRISRDYLPLILAAIGFKIAYAAFRTITLHYVWARNSFMKTLLDAPAPFAEKALAPVFGTHSAFFASHLGYFSFYVLSNFWLNTIVALVTAGIFYIFLRILQRRNTRFFESGEAEIGFIAVLAVGWPGIAIFIPMVFGAVVLVSLGRLMLYKESYTTLGLPFILAGIATLALQTTIAHFVNLTKL